MKSPDDEYSDGLEAEHAYDCLAAARSENSAISQNEEA